MSDETSVHRTERSHAPSSPTPRGARAALTATLALSTAAAADEPHHPIIGTWSGAWTRGDTSEISITRVDDDGAAYGLYCHQYPAFHSLGVVELHPDEATKASLTSDTLRFEVGNSRIEAKLDRDKDALVFSNRRAGADAKSMLPMTRIDGPQRTA